MVKSRLQNFSEEYGMAITAHPRQAPERLADSASTSEHLQRPCHESRQEAQLQERHLPLSNERGQGQGRQNEDQKATTE